MTPWATQLRRHIVGLESLAGSARKQRPMHRVAAGLRDDVHHESGGLRLTQSTRRGERHFLRLSHVYVVGGGRVAAGRTPDSQPIQQQPAFLLTAAVNGK